jgi:hypothetical protein
MVEVLRRYSNSYGITRRVRKLAAHLREYPPGDGPVAPLPRRKYRPQKLSRRLSDETVGDIVSAYQSGATTRELGEHFGPAHSSINKLLKQQDVKLRRRGPRQANL